MGSFDFTGNVNKFDVGNKYNECIEKKDYKGFYEWLASVAPYAIRKLVIDMIRNIREGLRNVKIGLFRGIFSKDKDGLPEAEANEYQNANHELYEKQEGNIFRGMGMTDEKGHLEDRYFNPEYFIRMKALDTFIEKHIKDLGGEIKDEQGNNITDIIINKAHKSIDLGKGEFTFTLEINGQKMDLRLLEDIHIKDMEKKLGREDIKSLASYNDGRFSFFDMNNPEVKKLMLDYELDKEAVTADVTVQEEKTVTDPVTSQKEVKEAPGKEIPAEEPDKEPEKPSKSHLDGDKLTLGITHYVAKDEEVYENIKFTEPHLKKITDRGAEMDRNRAFAKSITDNKDVSKIIVKINALSRMVEGNNLFKIPGGNIRPPKGIQNPGKQELFFKFPDKKVGKGIKRNELRNRDGSKYYVLVLSLDEKFEICNKDGVPLMGNNGPVTVKAEDLIGSFTIQAYARDLEKKTKHWPEAYIADKVKSPVKTVVFDEKTTKIAKDTIVDNPEVTEIDFNHAKLTIGYGAFKNLTGRIKLLNAENVTPEKNCFLNCGQPEIVVPDVISSDLGDVLADLTAKAATMGAKVAEPSVPISPAPEAIEKAVDKTEETKKVACKINDMLVMGEYTKGGKFEYSLYDSNCMLIDQGIKDSMSDVARGIQEQGATVESMSYEEAERLIEESNDRQFEAYASGQYAALYNEEDIDR